jgi:hypothetical protein
MAQNKTVQNHGSVDDFLASVSHKQRKADATVILDMMKNITGLEPAMWGKTLVGFDTYHYKYDSGREGDMFMLGCSPRKQNLVIYIVPGFEDYADHLARLGKHKSSVSCLYINKLDDVDMDVLEDLMTQSYKDMKAKYPVNG